MCTGLSKDCVAHIPPNFLGVAHCKVIRCILTYRYGWAVNDRGELFGQVARKPLQYSCGGEGVERGGVGRREGGAHNETEEYVDSHRERYTHTQYTHTQHTHITHTQHTHTTQPHTHTSTQHTTTTQNHKHSHTHTQPHTQRTDTTTQPHTQPHTTTHTTTHTQHTQTHTHTHNHHT